MTSRSADRSIKSGSRLRSTHWLLLKLEAEADDVSRTLRTEQQSAAAVRSDDIAPYVSQVRAREKKFPQTATNLAQDVNSFPLFSSSPKFDQESRTCVTDSSFPRDAASMMVPNIS